MLCRTCDYTMQKFKGFRCPRCGSMEDEATWLVIRLRALLDTTHVPNTLTSELHRLGILEAIYSPETLWEKFPELL